MFSERICRVIELEYSLVAFGAETFQIDVVGWL